MVLTVCFDVLHTCFSLEPLVDAVEEVMGAQLKEARSGARMVVMDWFHAAQRDFTMLSVVSAPPPPIAQILKLTLPRSLTFALQSTSPTSTSLTSTSLPDLTPITSKLTQLTPAPSLRAAWTALHDSGAKVILVTNGAEKSTRGYVEQGGLSGVVDRVLSCESIGVAKPDKKVYDRAKEVCREEGSEGEQWFVACHTWDVAAARKNGFKTGLVLSEQPPMDGQEDFWAMYGGKPDIIGRDLEEVCRGILAATSS